MRDASTVTARLYGFNRLPLAPKLIASIPGERDMRTYLLADAPEMSAHWRIRRLANRSGWMSWIRRDGSSRTPKVAYKLYVSPMPEAIREAVRELTPLLTDSLCVAFKLGATPSYLARSDKLVAYFHDRHELLRVANLVCVQLDGLTAHGVPFSFPVGSSGLVSYGMDPPHGADDLTSWRLWLCGELARRIAEAVPGQAIAAAEGWLRTIGIDPRTWKDAPDDFWERYGSE